jgi:hypothetical protein
LEFVLFDLYDRWCSLYLVVKLLPVFPTYALPQARHISLYTPEAEYLSTCAGFSFRCVCIVLLVLYAIFRFVFPKIWVIVRVSFPTYVKLTHFCSRSYFSGYMLLGLFKFFCVYFIVCGWYLLLYMMLIMVLYSLVLVSSLKL